MARHQASAPEARPQGTAVAGTPPSFHTRAVPPIRNPVYRYNMNSDFKRTPQPTHALERSSRVPAGVDPRLSVMGDKPRAGALTPVAGMAYQTPYNVFSLFPA